MKVKNYDNSSETPAEGINLTLTINRTYEEILKSLNETPSTIDELETPYDITFEMLSLVGIAVSVLCLLIQTSLFILIRSSRKRDEKILAQITVTRILIILCEHCLFYTQFSERLLTEIIFGLYFTSDFALVCLMMLFTKNLYNKIVVVFTNRALNLIYASIIIWIVSTFFGFTGVFILKFHIDYFDQYCKVIFGSAKFLIAFMNILLFLRIFYIAYKRGSINRNVNLKDVLKPALVAFLLVTTICLQILLNDIFSYVADIESVILSKIFCVINSFHSVPITIVFIIILKSKIRDSIVRTVVLKLSELAT